MNGQLKTLAAPRSLVKAGGSRAIAAGSAVTRAVGRSVTDPEVFWFTLWDWDTQAIWATARGFFDAYNSGRCDRCLDYMSESAMGEKAEAVIESLKRTKAHDDYVSVEAISDLMIAGSRASGTVDQIIRSKVVSRNMSFVKEKGSWRIAWPIFWDDNGLMTSD